MKSRCRHYLCERLTSRNVGAKWSRSTYVIRELGACALHDGIVLSCCLRPARVPTLNHTTLTVPPTTSDPNRSRNLAVLNTADTPYDVICDGGRHMSRDSRWRSPRGDHRDLSASTQIGREALL